MTSYLRIAVAYIWASSVLLSASTDSPSKNKPKLVYGTADSKADSASFKINQVFCNTTTPYHYYDPSTVDPTANSTTPGKHPLSIQWENVTNTQTTSPIPRLKDFQDAGTDIITKSTENGHQGQYGFMPDGSNTSRLLVRAFSAGTCLAYPGASPKPASPSNKAYSLLDVDYYVINIVQWSRDTGDAKSLSTSSNNWFLFNVADKSVARQTPFKIFRPSLSTDTRIYGTKKIGFLAVHLIGSNVTTADLANLQIKYNVAVKATQPMNVQDLTSLIGILGGVAPGAGLREKRPGAPCDPGDKLNGGADVNGCVPTPIGYYGGGYITGIASIPDSITMSAAVTQVPSPPDAPTVSISSLVSGSTVSGTVSLAATAAASSPAKLASVQFQLDGNPLGGPVTKSPFTTPWATAAGTNGAHVLAALVTDSLGQTNRSIPVTVMVANPGGLGPIAPTVSLTSPVPNSNISGLVTLSASVSQSNIAALQFELDGGALGAPISAAPYTYNWDTTKGVANGKHTLTAIATDSLGQNGTAPVATVMVQNAPLPVAAAPAAPTNTQPAPSASDCQISATATGSGSCSFSEVYSDEGPYHWDVSVGVPLTALKGPNYKSVDGIITANTVSSINAYGFFDIYPVATDIIKPPFFTYPHIMIGLPFSGKVLDKPFFGAGGVFSILRIPKVGPALAKFLPVQFDFYGGVVWDKEPQPKSLAVGSMASQEALSENIFGHRVWKGQFGVEFSIRDVKSKLTGGSTKSTTTNGTSKSPTPST